MSTLKDELIASIRHLTEDDEQAEEIVVQILKELYERDA